MLNYRSVLHGQSVDNVYFVMFKEYNFSANFVLRLLLEILTVKHKACVDHYLSEYFHYLMCICLCFDFTHLL